MDVVAYFVNIFLQYFETIISAYENYLPQLGFVFDYLREIADNFASSLT